MRFLLNRKSEQILESSVDGRKKYFLDALLCLPLALLFSLAWTFVNLKNVGQPFDLLSHIGIQTLVMVVLFILFSVRHLFLVVFFTSTVIILPSFFVKLPFFERVYSLLQNFVFDIRDSFLWSFEMTQEGVARPANYTLYISILSAFIAYVFIWQKPLPFFLGAIMLLPFFGGFHTNALDYQILIALGICLFVLGVVFSREGKMYQKKHFFGIPPLVLISAIVLAALLIQHFVPDDFFQNKNLRDQIRQAQKRMTSPEIVNYYEFSLRDAGYYPLSQTLGGPLTLNHNLYMNVSGPASALRLRAAVSEEYTGNAWRGEEMEPNYIFDNESTHGKQAQIFSYPSSIRGGEDALEPFFSRNTLTIEPLQIPVQVVFNGGKPTFIQEITTENQIYYFNNGGQVYAGLEIENPYRVEGWIQKELPTTLKFNMLSEGINNNTFSISRVPKSNSYKTMLEKHDPELAEIVYQEHDNSDKSYLEVLKQIEKHLSTTYTYELDVPYPDPSEDFLEGFIKTREGYCTYFATAYTLLAREAGINARYVEGFVVPSIDKEQYLGELDADGNYLRQVLSDAAHAWIEVYFEGLGWYAFDATPPDVLQGFTNQEDPNLEETPPDENPTAEVTTEVTSSEESSARVTSPPTLPKNSLPENQPSESKPSEPPPAEEEPPPPPPSSLVSPELYPWLWLIGGVLLLFIALVVFLSYCKRRYDNRLDREYLLRVADKQGDRTLLEQLWNDIKEMYHLTGNSFPHNRTLQQKFILLDKTFEESKTHGSYPAFINLEKSFFAETALSDGELLTIFDYYHVVEKDLKASLKPSKWWFKRYLFPAKTAKYKL